MSILRVEQIQKLDGSDFFPDLSRFLWEEEILTTEGAPSFPEKNKLHLIEGVGGVVYLPIGNDGDRIAFSDKESNFTSATVTLLPYPNSGNTIGGSNSWQLANDNDSAGFIFYTGNWVPIWSTQSDPTDPNELAPVLYNQENLSALPGFLYLLDGTRNVILPDAENNDRIGFADYFGRFGQEGYSVTLVPSFPDNIGGDSTYTVSENNAYIEIIYRNGRWIFLESPPSKTLGDGEVLSEGFTFPNDGLRIQDSENQQESLIISPGENLSEDRTLTINVNGGDRELNLLGNVTLGGSNSGDQLISLSGDVVAAAGESNLVTTIQNGSVTFPKMAPVNSGAVVGRLSSGSGDLEEITLNSLKSAISGTDAGDLVILPSNGVLPALSGENLTNVAPSLEIRDEGVSLTNAVSAIDFTGLTVQATESAGIVTVDLSSAGDAQTSNGLDQFSPTTSNELSSIITDETGAGNLVFSGSPQLTGIPTAPTAVNGTNTTQLATTEFVQNSLPQGPTLATEVTVDTSGFSVITGTILQDHLEANDSALEKERTTGVSSGGEIIVEGVGTTFTISAGEGQILDETPPLPYEYYALQWPETTGIATAGNGFNYVFVDNAGNILTTTTPPTPDTMRTRLYLWRLEVVGGIITSFKFVGSLTKQYAVNLKELADIVGIKRSLPTEMIPQPLGASLEFSVTSGRFFSLGGNYPNKLDPNNIPFPAFTTSGIDTFRYVLPDGTSPGGQVSTLDISNYAPGGVITTIPGSNNRVGAHYVWRFSNSGEIVVTYGADFYTSMGNAVGALDDITAIASAPTFFSGRAFLLGAILAVKNETDLNNATFISTNQSGSFSGGSLASLGGVGGMAIPYLIILEDRKPAGTYGGSSVAGENTRVLNTKRTGTDPEGRCSLSGNQFTLQPGDYAIKAYAPVFAGNTHRLSIYDITNSQLKFRGPNGTSSPSYLGAGIDRLDSEPFTLAAPTTFELRHYIGAAKSTNGLGGRTGHVTGEEEVYSRVLIEVYA